jgi:hypothetical protein
VVGYRHAPTAFIPAKRPGAHFVGDWVSLTVGPDGYEEEKVFSLPAFEPETTQPVASLCRLRHPGTHKDENYLSYIYRLSSYRAVTTLRLGYKNRSVNTAQVNNLCLFWDPYETHKCFVWAERRRAFKR